MRYEHRVGRVLSISPVVGIGTPPPLLPQASLPPHPLFRGGGHTRLRLKGWGSPNSNEGTYTVVLYIYKYFVGTNQEKFREFQMCIQHFLSMRIWTQNPDPGVWWPKNGEKNSSEKNFPFFDQNCNLQDVQATWEVFIPRKRTASTSKL